MAERHRSKDGRSETQEILDDMPEMPGQSGRDGGDLARKTGTKDELRHTTNSSAGATRVTKSDEDRPGTDNLGERNK
ncbi:hypothetical protein HKCCE4037_02405 [Rhodobacterales bacterium HKCCE4037]|nr:hypothetical protein [Rhodobacterales bacterium HKCCE4037]